MILILWPHLASASIACTDFVGVELAEAPKSGLCTGSLSADECCGLCNQRRESEGCVVAVWNSSRCCSFYSTYSGYPSKSQDGSITYISSWAPLPPAPPTASPTSKVPCGNVSSDGTTWEISTACIATCSSPSCSFIFDVVYIDHEGVLQIDESKTYTRIHARLFIVDGKLIAGSVDAPFTAGFDIVLTGRSADQDDPSIKKEIVKSGKSGLPYSKVLLARKGSTISLHGKPKASWIKLIDTAKVGSSILKLSQYPSGWEVGDIVVVPTTGMIQEVQNEEVTVTKITKFGHGAIVTIKEKLVYDHYGGSFDTRLNGEAGILSHNIRIMGDNSDNEYRLCTTAMSVLQFVSKEQSQVIRERCYGAHTAILEGSMFQLSNVELKRVGQATRIARYPIHWHLAKDVGVVGSYVRSTSIWESYQRCVTLHGTWGATVEDNICYKVFGHAFYLEDAIEHNNRFVRNLAVHVRRGPMICTDVMTGPSAFWITNPNNTYIENLAVDVGDRTSGMGYWIISGGEIDKEDGPGYLYNPDYWTTEYQSKQAGLIFNPSRETFDGDVPDWMLRQQQARMPLKEFRGNGVRSSFRGVHIDGFVTSSVPGEVGTAPHNPEDLPVFEKRQPDGTCNYFPKTGGSNPGAEGVHVYAPVQFSYSSDGHAYNYTAAWSIIDGMHISRCYDTWWSRAARINITNSLFAWNWIGMTNENTGNYMCPNDGDHRNPGLVNHIVESLFIGHGDSAMNKLLCENGDAAKHGMESPAGIRQYDGAFWLSSSRWVNMSTVSCGNTSGKIKSLPYALVAGRQTSCNEKWPIHLYGSWPLGASPTDVNGPWGWALTLEKYQNLAQFTGTASCDQGPAGGVVDMTGTLDPIHPSTTPTAYFAFETELVQNGELAYNTTSEVNSYHYSELESTKAARVVSKAWAHQAMENADFNHICGYCFYKTMQGRCHKGMNNAV